MRFKVGDKVILKAHNKICKSGFSYGDICEIDYIGKELHYPIRIRKKGEGIIDITGFADEDELELYEGNFNLTKYEIEEK